MSSTASPARITACSAAATNERSCGYCRSSEVWPKNTSNAPRSILVTLPRRGAKTSRSDASAGKPVSHGEHHTRRVFGDVSFAQAWEQGQALTLDDAVA